MSDTNVKFIDLDAMAAPVLKRVRLNGVEHDIAELNIGNFNRAIELQTRLDELFVEGEEANPMDSLKAYADLILISIPSMTYEEITKLNLPQWQGLVEFITTSGLQGAPDEGDGEELGKSQEETVAE